MVCIHCGSKTQVINSRNQKRANQVWRRRRCNLCDAVFTTVEAADIASAWLVTGPLNRPTSFSRDKLFVSLLGSLQHRSTALSDAASLTDTIIKQLAAHIKDGATSSRTIAQLCQVALNRFDKAASTHYRAFHP